MWLQDGGVYALSVCCPLVGEPVGQCVEGRVERGVPWDVGGRATSCVLCVAYMPTLCSST